jgi:hypothetical protein
MDTRGYTHIDIGKLQQREFTQSISRQIDTAFQSPKEKKQPFVAQNKQDVLKIAKALKAQAEGDTYYSVNSRS